MSGDNAIFEGTPGTVTLGEAITANSITFDASLEQLEEWAVQILEAKTIEELFA